MKLTNALAHISTPQSKTNPAPQFQLPQTPQTIPLKLCSQHTFLPPRPAGNPGLSQSLAEPRFHRPHARAPPRCVNPRAGRGRPSFSISEPRNRRIAAVAAFFALNEGPRARASFTFARIGSLSLRKFAERPGNRGQPAAINYTPAAIIL